VTERHWHRPRGERFSKPPPASCRTGTDILISDFDVALLGDQPDSKRPHELRQTIEGITATRNSPSVLMGARAGGAVASAVQCAGDDLFLKATFDTLSDAASDQLTGRRPGMLVAAFDGIAADELRSVAERQQRSRSTNCAAPEPHYVRRTDARRHAATAQGHGRWRI